MAIPTLDLDGKVAIVTGAGKGIGKKLAIHLASAGARVVCVARTQKQIDETVSVIRKHGGKSLAFAADVTRNNDLQALVDITVSVFGTIDILVNNAGGIEAPYLAKNSSEEYFDQTFALNARAPFMLAQRVAPVMEGNADGGSIVNISSRAANMVYPGLSIYGGAKAALEMMSRHMAAEWAPKIRINNVSLGFVLTDQSHAWTASEPGAVESLASRIPMGRLGLPEDIASAVIFLCSNQSSWITGKVLEVDGGIYTPLAELQNTT
jgi:7-alpha-hydroxysteroid dehydrogenase